MLLAAVRDRLLPASAGIPGSARHAHAAALGARPFPLSWLYSPSLIFILFLIIILIFFFFYPYTRHGIKKGQCILGWIGVSQAGGGSFGVLAGAEEGAKAEPLLYSSSSLGARGHLRSLAKQHPVVTGGGFGTGYPRGGG